MLVLEFIFRALPHIFRAKSIQPPAKNGPYAYGFDLKPTLTVPFDAPPVSKCNQKLLRIRMVTTSEPDLDAKIKVSCFHKQDAQLSQRDRAMRRVS